MDKQSGRWIILLAAVDLIFFAISGLFGRTKHVESAGVSTDWSYNTVCQEQADPDACNSWRTQAITECIGVVFLAAAAWTYNDRRAIKP